MNWNTKWIPIFLISRIVSCSPDPTPNPTSFVKIVLIGQKTFSYSDFGFVSTYVVSELVVGSDEQFVLCFVSNLIWNYSSSNGLM